MRYLLLIIIISAFCGCSYQVSRNYQTTDLPQSEIDCGPLIVLKRNLYGLKFDYLGSMKLDDSGFSINCSKDKAMERLIKEACLLKSNLINITSEVHPSIWSSCYQCTADFYDMEFDETSQKIIADSNRIMLKYKENGSITWSDFKRSLPDNSSVPYEFISTIELWAGDASFWTGAFKDFRAQGVFFGDVSSVKPSFATKSNLNHIQVLYDLAHIHAKKLERLLTSSKPKSSKGVTILEIQDRYLNDLLTDQAMYMKETAYGANREAQQKWMERIKNEMEILESERD